jgi:Holliday junction resolvase RusA-like endonuclease
LEGALTVVVDAIWMLPRSASKRNPPTHKASRPDADNIGKQIGDALNGVVWRDDAQIVDIRVRKLYGPAARTVVTVEPMGW